MKKIILGITILTVATIAFFYCATTIENDNSDLNLKNLSLIKNANAEASDGKTNCYGAYKNGDEANVHICDPKCPTKDVLRATKKSLCP